MTQQPLPHTVDDYLRLIFDQHISTVVTLESDINTNPVSDIELYAVNYIALLILCAQVLL